MAKAGQTKSTTTKDKNFAGTGVEGQKGQDAEQVTSLPPSDPPADETTKQEPKVITGEHVLKQLRDKGHQV